MSIKVFKYFLLGLGVCSSSLMLYGQQVDDHLEALAEECLALPYHHEDRVTCMEEILAANCEKNELSNERLFELNIVLSATLVRLGEFEQSEFYANSAMEVAEQFFESTSFQKLKALHVLAHVKENSRDYYEALILRQKIELIRRKNLSFKFSEDEHEVIIDNYVCLAKLNQIVGNNEALAEMFTNLDTIRQSEVYVSDLTYSGNDLQLMDVLRKINQPRLALDIGRSLISLTEDDCARTNRCRLHFYALTLQAEIHLSEGDVARAQGLLAEAIRYLPVEKGIDMDEFYYRVVELRAFTLAKDFTQLDKQVDYLLKGMRENQTVDPGSRTQIYAEIAYAYLQRGVHTTQEKDIRRAYEYIQQGMVSWEEISRASPSQDDIRYSLQEYYRLFEVGFNVLYELFRYHPDDPATLNTALKYFEATKNIELRTSLRRASVAKELGVPSHLLQRQQKWNQEIFALNLKVDQDTSLSSVERLALEEEQNKLKSKLNNLEEKLLRDYPAYVNRLNNNSELDEFALAEHLAATQQSVVYFLAADHHLFTIAISPEGYAFHRADISRDSLASLVDKVRELVNESPHEPSKEGLDRLALRSHQLYNILLAPIDSILTERLVVIPDGPTEILPFSLLLTSTTDHTQSLMDWPFLIRAHSISYAYGLELWLQQLNYRPQTRPTQNRILAFAPTFSSITLRDENLRAEGDLTYNQAEVDFIARRFPAQTYTAAEARLPFFREHASDYSILHLATHASANTEVGEYSYLSFAPVDSFDHHLEVGELYNMDIPAELVVLSACETGIGEWQRGEGVIGLERAFAFAGAESLVTTHWRVSDRASADFMSGFYAQLAGDLPKDEALRQAQLTFMAEHDDWLAHPFYWAAYVQKGNTDPIPVRRRRYWGYWASAALALLLLGNWFYRKKLYAS